MEIYSANIKSLGVLISKYYLLRCDVGLNNTTKVNITEKVEEKEKHKKPNMLRLRFSPSSKIRTTRFERIIPCSWPYRKKK